MSVAQYRQLVAAAERREAVGEALASVRAEGLEPSPEGLETLAEIAEGRMSTEQARAHVGALPQVSWDPYLDLDSGVLRNRLDITDAGELAEVEAELTSYRLVETARDRAAGRLRPGAAARVPPLHLR